MDRNVHILRVVRLAPSLPKPIVELGLRVHGAQYGLVAGVQERSTGHGERERSGFRVSGRTIFVRPVRTLRGGSVVGFPGRDRSAGGDRREDGGGDREDERDRRSLHVVETEGSRGGRVARHGSERACEDIHELLGRGGGHEDVGEKRGQDQGDFGHRYVEKARDAFQSPGRSRMSTFRARHGAILGMQRETRVRLVLSRVWDDQDGTGQRHQGRGRLEAEGARSRRFAGDRWIGHSGNPCRQS